jgi:hypothetical protein
LCGKIVWITLEKKCVQTLFQTQTETI